CRVRIPGYELPPLMWIFEWNMVGGWNSLLSLVYRSSRDGLERAIDEGYAAAALVRRARGRLQSVFATACGERRADCAQMLRSLEYEETLFDALAAWRHAFLAYYRWLDTGDRQAWAGWELGRDRFERAAAEHRERFAHDPDFPAFDLTSAG